MGFDLWSALAPGLFGLAGTALGGWLTWKTQSDARERDHKAQREALSLAIAAEIESYLDLMAARDHLATARAIAETNEQGQYFVPKNWMIKEERSQSPFPILEANLSKIGILGPIVSDLARFHRRVSGVRTTIMGVMDGSLDEASPAMVAKVVRSEVELWQSAIEIGGTLVPRLREVAASSL